MTERLNLQKQMVKELERLVQNVDVTLPGLAPGNVTGEVVWWRVQPTHMWFGRDFRNVRTKEMLSDLLLTLGRVVNDKSKSTDKHNNLFLATQQCRASIKDRNKFPGTCDTKTRKGPSRKEKTKTPKGPSRNEKIRLLNDQIATQKASLRRMHGQEKEIHSRISATQSRARELRTSIVALQQELAKLKNDFKQLNTDCDILVELKKLTQKEASPSLRQIFNTVTEQTKRLHLERCGPVTEQRVQEEKAQIKQDLEAEEAELASLSAEFEKNTQQLRGIEEKRAKIENMLDRLRTELTRVESEMDLD